MSFSTSPLMSPGDPCASSRCLPTLCVCLYGVEVTYQFHLRVARVQTGKRLEPTCQQLTDACLTETLPLKVALPSREF